MVLFSLSVIWTTFARLYGLKFLEEMNALIAFLVHFAAKFIMNNLNTKIFFKLDVNYVPALSSSYME